MIKDTFCNAEDFISKFNLLRNLSGALTKPLSIFYNFSMITNTAILK